MTIEESLARKIKHCDEIMEERDQALKERDEARAEVERLKAQHLERHLESWEQYMQDNDVRQAYRRGAEAMREACADVVRELLDEVECDCPPEWPRCGLHRAALRLRATPLVAEDKPYGGLVWTRESAERALREIGILEEP
jgi:hypothetical protein